MKIQVRWKSAQQCIPRFIIKHSLHIHTINNFFFCRGSCWLFMYTCLLSCLLSVFLSPFHTQSSTHLQRKFTCFNIKPGFHWHSDSDSQFHSLSTLLCMCTWCERPPRRFDNGFASITQFFPISSHSDNKNEHIMFHRPLHRSFMFVLCIFSQLVECEFLFIFRMESLMRAQQLGLTHNLFVNDAHFFSKTSLKLDARRVDESCPTILLFLLLLLLLAFKGSFDIDIHQIFKRFIHSPVSGFSALFFGEM